MLSRKAGEEEIKELFAPFGDIREIFMIRNADGSSKCAAFLRYVKREAAVQAIESLHNNIVMDGAARPLIVKFADNQRQRQQRQQHELAEFVQDQGFAFRRRHAIEGGLGIVGEAVALQRREGEVREDRRVGQHR